MAALMLPAARAYEYISDPPITFVGQTCGPSLIPLGATDEIVPVDNSRRMTDVLLKARAEVVYGEFSVLDHLGIVDLNPVGPQTLAFTNCQLGISQ